jgi:uncharacterized protein involved in exopolysaccharide biosynthesis
MNEASTSSNPRFAFTHWEVFAPLRQHVSFIVLFTLSAALAALAITYIYDEKYQADVTIIIKPTEVTRLKQHTNEDVALGVQLPNDIEYKVITQSISDLATSEPLLRRVVTRLHLDNPPNRDYTAYPFYERWWYETEDWLDDTAGDIWSILKYGRIVPENLTNKEIEKLAAKDVKVSSTDSYIYVLSVRDKVARRVRPIADAIAAEMIASQQVNDQYHAELRANQLRDRLKLKYDEVQNYESQIRTLLANAHVGGVQDDLTTEENIYSGLENNRLGVEAEITQTEAKIASADAQLKNAGDNGDNVVPGAQRLQGDDYKKTLSDRLANEILLAGDRRKSADLAAAITKSKARLAEFPRLQVQYDLLDSERKRAQHDYDLINDALQEEILQERSNVSPLLKAGPASSSGNPVTPIKVYHVGLALALGVLVALGIAFVFGYFEIFFFVSPKWIERQPKRREDEPIRGGILGAAPVLD